MVHWDHRLVLLLLLPLPLGLLMMMHLPMYRTMIMMDRSKQKAQPMLKTIDSMIQDWRKETSFFGKSTIKSGAHMARFSSPLDDQSNRTNGNANPIVDRE